MNKHIFSLLLLISSVTFVRAEEAESTEVVKSQQSLHQAAIDFDVEAVRALLGEQTKADINRVDDNGNNALMAAFASGKACDDPACEDKKALNEVVTMFINNGIDLTTKNNDGDTALDIAKANGYKEAAELIENTIQE